MFSILLDSSNTSLTVGLAKDDILLESISYEAWQTQSEHMIPELDKLLNKYDVIRNQISDVVVAIGPGSYTGVRIAITIAKTIAAVLPVKVYAISSLRCQKDGKNHCQDCGPRRRRRNRGGSQAPRTSAQGQNDGVSRLWIYVKNGILPKF